MSDARTPRFGVVIVNYNGSEDTAACLASLAAAEPGPDAVIVVDNASRDADREALVDVARGGDADVLVATDEAEAMNGSARTVVLLASENGGFAGGNNAGLRVLAARPEITHFLLLNNDATVAPDYFAALAAALAAAPDAGVLSGTVYVAEAPDEVWYAGGVELPWRALFLHAYDVPDDPTPLPTPFVSGCTMLVSRATLRAIGPLPECYFPGYWEDAEYCTRAREAGLPVLYAPGVRAYHKGGASFGSPITMPRVAYLQNRHRALYVRRNMRGVHRAAALLYLLVTKPGRCVYDAIRGRPRRGWAVLRGMVDGLTCPVGR